MAVKHFNTDDFSNEIEKGAIIVDFWAEWCEPCQSLLPIIDELATDLEGKAIVGKVNVDEEKPLARQYHVMSIPTVIFFKDGIEKDRLVGAYPKQKYLDALEKIK